MFAVTCRTELSNVPAWDAGAAGAAGAVDVPGVEGEDRLWRHLIIGREVAGLLLELGPTPGEA